MTTGNNCQNQNPEQYYQGIMATKNAVKPIFKAPKIFKQLPHRKNAAKKVQQAITPGKKELGDWTRIRPTSDGPKNYELTVPTQLDTKTILNFPNMSTTPSLGLEIQSLGEEEFNTNTHLGKDITAPQALHQQVNHAATDCICVLDVQPQKSSTHFKQIRQALS